MSAVASGWGGGKKGVGVALSWGRKQIEADGRACGSANTNYRALSLVIVRTVWHSSLASTELASTHIRSPNPPSFINTYSGKLSVANAIHVHPYLGIGFASKLILKPLGTPSMNISVCIGGTITSHLCSPVSVHVSNLVFPRGVTWLSLPKATRTTML